MASMRCTACCTVCPLCVEALCLVRDLVGVSTLLARLAIRLSVMSVATFTPETVPLWVRRGCSWPPATVRPWQLTRCTCPWW